MNNNCGGYDLSYEDLNPTFLFISQISRCEDETNYHCHDFIEVAILLKGQARYFIDGNWYEAKEGDFIILNPGTYHKSLILDPANRATECYLAFTGIHFKGMEENRFALAGGRFLFSMDGILKQEVFRICTAMTKEYKTCRPGRYFMLKSYLIQLLVLLIREQIDSAASPGILSPASGYVFESTGKKYVVAQIIRYLDEHYQEKISLDQIAKNMYLSTFYISKIFKSETGDTPINYLIALRMEKAKELMEESPGESIQSIAALVGYEDVYHFSKLFKKHFGVAPSQYKRGVNQ